MSFSSPKSNSSSASSPYHLYQLPPIYTSMDDMLNPEEVLCERPREYLDTFIHVGNFYI